MTDEAAPSGRIGWLSLTVVILFGLVYVYDLWEAFGNLINLPALYDAIGLPASAIPWWLLVIGVLIPPASFALAFLIGRRQKVFGKALIFVVGLAVVASLSLGLMALEVVLRPSFITLS